MKKMIVIDECFQCPHFFRNSVSDKLECDKKEKEILDPYKIPKWCPLPNTPTCWFYCCGPHGEMIIDNNQNKIARIYNLSQGVISACLRGERRGHKGWRFTLIENPQPFVAAEKKKKSIMPEIEPVMQKPAPAQKKESDAKHIDTATAAGIRCPTSSR